MSSSLGWYGRPRCGSCRSAQHGRMDQAPRSFPCEFLGKMDAAPQASRAGGQPAGRRQQDARSCSSGPWPNPTPGCLRFGGANRGRHEGAFLKCAYQAAELIFAPAACRLPPRKSLLATCSSLGISHPATRARLVPGYKALGLLASVCFLAWQLSAECCGSSAPAGDALPVLHPRSWRPGRGSGFLFSLLHADALVHVVSEASW